MLKTLLSSAFILTLIQGRIFAQESFIINKKGKLPYKVTELVFAKFKKTATAEEKVGLALRYQMQPSVNHSSPSPTAHTNVRMLTINSGYKPIEMVSQVEKDPAVETALYFIVVNNKDTLGVSNEILLSLKEGTNISSYQEDLTKAGVTAWKKGKVDTTYYILTVPASRAISISNKLQESGQFASAEVNFTIPIKKQEKEVKNSHLPLPYDRFYSQIQLNEAHEFSRGSGAVVAIIDDGVQLDHPDLIGQLTSPGYDATGDRNDAYPYNIDHHGTGCAGIVVANYRSDLPIRGAAYEAKVLPIRFWKYEEFPLGRLITTSGYIKDAFFYARSRADFISCSWEISSFLFSLDVDDAFNNAVILGGRRGQGAIMFAAAGNDNTSLAYPARLGRVTAVGATKELDLKADYSNFGGNLYFAVQGNGIIGLSNPNTYNNDFAGTSAATPLAAAIAALVYSINSNFSANDIRDIMRNSCDKVGGYNYSIYSDKDPSSTYCAELGYGRLNAFSAVKEAIRRTIRIDGPVTVQAGKLATFTVSQTLPGVSVVWSTDNPQVSIDPNSGTITAINPSFYAQVTIQASLRGAGGSLAPLPSKLIFAEGSDPVKNLAFFTNDVDFRGGYLFGRPYDARFAVVNGPLDGATYTWTVSPNVDLRDVDNSRVAAGGTWTSLALVAAQPFSFRNGESATGTVSCTIKLSEDDEPYTLTKEVKFGYPGGVLKNSGTGETVELQDVNNVCPGEYDIVLNAPGEAGDYQWILTGTKTLWTSGHISIAPGQTLDLTGGPPDEGSFVFINKRLIFTGVSGGPARSYIKRVDDDGGDQFICNGESKVYRLFGDPLITTVNWEVGPGLVVIDGQGSIQCRVQATNEVTNSMASNLTARVTSANPCGTNVPSLVIYPNLYPDYFIVNFTETYDNQYYYIGDGVVWESLSGRIILECPDKFSDFAITNFTSTDNARATYTWLDQAGRRIEIDILTPNTSITVGLEGRTGCGEKQQMTFVMKYAFSCAFCASAVSPNPASSTATIDFNQKRQESPHSTLNPLVQNNVKRNMLNSAITPKGSVSTLITVPAASREISELPESVDLLSANSMVPLETIQKSEISRGQNKAVFNVKNLKPGFYYIHLHYKDRVDKQTLQVN